MLAHLGTAALGIFFGARAKVKEEVQLVPKAQSQIGILAPGFRAGYREFPSQYPVQFFNAEVFRTEAKFSWASFSSCHEPRASPGPLCF